MIYGIVLTIALILYYITLIMMDLNAKNKKENKNELTINSGDDTEDEDEEYAPQSVVETSAGGFDLKQKKFRRQQKKSLTKKNLRIAMKKA